MIAVALADLTDSDSASSIHRILVVDDDPAIRFLLNARLQIEPDFRVVAEATNGREAIAAAALHRPSSVVLDLDMPVLDGVQAIPLLREAVPDVRIVVYSATSPAVGFAEGCAPDGIIIKGVPLAEVVVRLRQIMADPHRKPTLNLV